MPKKPAHDPTYGYDPETTTVRVAQHDLARLLLMFRKLMREQPPSKWKHMDDYDLSFERLADAVDASSQIRCGKRWTGPDLRMRCTTTEPVYRWPGGAPYDGGATFTWTVPGYGSHATKDERFRGITHRAVRVQLEEGRRAAPGGGTAGLSRVPARGPGWCRTAPRHLVTGTADPRCRPGGYGRGYDAERHDPGSCDAGVVALSPGGYPSQTMFSTVSRRSGRFTQ
ncbi:hypothetical protein OOK39_45955 [Streptomyces sp. NBC_00264]|uniref:hypothetical protein n=1 Tax=unclassified Streptomyces TaxID=2593676 RepID=UPI000F99B0D9|nr:MULTISPECIES: hypothetical protein [unclassified Streptomyces]WSG48418.1 hypothetical protein OHA38_00325 [Streptomyces sp. NBC_01732]WSW99067.1 hypothetical protein OG355_00435 [Streptomyces sp. NBC_00987]MCX5166364.1 hypothetical protein [Streptomyces sp. NBC_00305]MCX5224881.1 hypothetical protein [Streptomyces sp. NBC_00264]RPK54212.1 hypothetical protein EES42_43465 [Streptomyces sp. ADI95-17]